MCLQIYVTLHKKNIICDTLYTKTILSCKAARAILGERLKNAYFDISRVKAFFNEGAEEILRPKSLVNPDRVYTDLYFAVITVV